NALNSNARMAQQESQSQRTNALAQDHLNLARRRDPYDEAMAYQEARDRAIDKDATSVGKIPFTNVRRIGQLSRSPAPPLSCRRSANSPMKSSALSRLAGTIQSVGRSGA